MMLGKRQLEALDKYPAYFKVEPDDGYRLEVRILPWRRFTREAGGGSGFPIVMKGFATDAAGIEQEMEGKWIACCAMDNTAIEKGQEIARYLVAAGCPKERIRIRRT